ncbi:MAG: peptidylprolyl isomerase [Pelagibacterales bacterium]|nr:peptidylprolyl isomerase [Pelagibacterales bacterium]
MKYLILSIVSLVIFMTNKGFAENKFDPVIIVNETIISKFELSQRIMLLNILQLNGDIQKKASDELINGKLINEFARNNNISISEEKVQEGIRELAQQFNLSIERFLFEVSKIELATETIRTFVKDRILLREIVQYKFGNRASIGDDEIDSFIINGSASLELNLLEIVLPFDYNNRNEVYNLALSLKNKNSEGITFEALAKKYSKSDSSINGGNIGWISIDQLAPDMGSLFLISDLNTLIGPKVFDNVIILYKLANVREVPLFKNTRVMIDYVELNLSKNSEINLSSVVQLFENNNNCLNLQFELERYPTLKGKLIKNTIEELKISEKKYEKIKTLDIGENAILEGGDLSEDPILIMLCSRQQEISKNDRETARQYLFSKRLVSLAEGFIADLKAEAKIVYK